MRNTDFFVAKAKKVHGDRYNYSKSLYKGLYKKLIVICKVHGEFQIKPKNHYIGHGCYLCYLEKYNYKIDTKPNAKKVYKRNKANRNKEKDTINRKILIWAKKLKLINIFGGVCSCCGEKRIWSLCFHHKNPKTKEKSLEELRSRKVRFEDLIKEAKKCILICHNCHRGLHPIKNEKAIKNKKLCFEYKNKSKCYCCEYSECLNALEFHHENEDKNFKISGEIPYKKWKSVTDLEDYIKKELDKCLILCRNCHQEVHTDTRFFYDHEKEIIEKSKSLLAKNKVNEIQVLEMKEKGLNAYEIASNLKCSSGRIYEILKSYRI